MSFAGKRVLSLESRRAAETAELIRRNGGEPFVAPSMREVPVEENGPALEFGDRLLAAEFDMVILLTGVGTKFLLQVLSTRYQVEQIAEALRRVTTVARGPKPSAALREIGVTPTVFVPEPNTWRELLQAIDGRPERRVAVQEYGRSGPELIEGLQARGAEVTQVPVYRYEMPEDLGPLRDAVTRLAERSFEVTLFTSSQQVENLFELAREMHLEDAVRGGLRSSLIASIGPTMTETLNDYGLPPDLEPSHPKLGILVKESAERSEEVLWAKRN